MDEMPEPTEATDEEPTEATDLVERGDTETDSDDDGGHRIILDLTEDAYHKLKGTADRSHSTVADLARNGLALAEWLEEEQSRGAKVLIKRGGQLREVTLPNGADDE